MRVFMKTTRFFSILRPKVDRLVSTDIAFILSDIKPGSLLILDIDDTVGRVSQTLGLDAWFRYRIQQFIDDGHPESEALAQTIVIYNMAQLASRQMIPVDNANPVGPLINAIKSKGASVIGLTARNDVLVEQTLNLLATNAVEFSQDVLIDGAFTLDNRRVCVKNGVIFANGNNKGLCIESALTDRFFIKMLHSFSQVDVVDDSARNCDAIAESLNKLLIPNSRVWHYTYAEQILRFEEVNKARAKVQEHHLVNYHRLLNDEEADEELRQGQGLTGKF